MARNKIWLGKVRTIKVKLNEETFYRYKAQLISEKKTIQDDIQNYIIEKLK